MFIKPVGDLLAMSAHPHLALTALGDTRPTDRSTGFHLHRAAFAILLGRGIPNTIFLINVWDKVGGFFI